jgi:hypothetical protein
MSRLLISTKGSQYRSPILIILECEMILWRNGLIEPNMLEDWINEYNM